jgi:hypothetical protein
MFVANSSQMILSNLIMVFKSTLFCVIGVG